VGELLKEGEKQQGARGMGKSGVVARNATSAFRAPSEGKIGRAVLTVALVAATAMLVLVLVSFVGLIVQRSFQGAPMHDRQAFHTAPQPPEHAQP
jgi:hypothetical protein